MTASVGLPKRSSTTDHVIHSFIPLFSITQNAIRYENSGSAVPIGRQSAFCTEKRPLRYGMLEVTSILHLDNNFIRKNRSFSGQVTHFYCFVRKTPPFPGQNRRHQNGNDQSQLFSETDCQQIWHPLICH